ncbi:MAG: TIGR04211 family SH3 domain-containing protein [Campylobacterota bacterium]|nr:TIGR04211 family SH3 domain-containing protein [Campylobacterota bacterium]
MIRKTTLLLFVIISLASSASALTRYVSDDLFTYMHSGPGTKYKIIGSVDAGEKIKVLKTNENTGYTQIVDPKGRTGWINTKYVSRQAGLKERLEKLEIKYAKLKTQLNSTKENLNSHGSQVRELEKTNATINKEMQEVQTLNDELIERLDTEKLDILLRWFTYGGMVGGIGLFLGLILPSLIPDSRKKRSRW